MHLTIGEFMNAGASFIRVSFLKIMHLHHFYAQGYKFFLGRRVKFSIKEKGFIDIGSKTWISDYCQLVVSGGAIRLGYNNYLNRNVSITALDEIIIGNNNLFGPNIVIVDHGHKYTDGHIFINQQGYECGAVSIGSNCWICAGVVICHGVKIADYVVVAANAVVTHDLLKPGLYAGVPARLVKSLEGHNG